MTSESLNIVNFLVIIFLWKNKKKTSNKQIKHKIVNFQLYISNTNTLNML